ncbi:MAG: helix-turn-helix transcriptional regulator [Haloglomus sp.]
MEDSDSGELLDDAVTRREALAALREGPLHRRDLEKRLGVSKTTCHRILQRFDEHGLLRRTEDGYRLSELGQVVEDEVAAAARAVQTAQELEPLVSAFGSAAVDLDISLFAEAEVTRAEPTDPYPPVGRFIELLRESSTLRSLDRTSIAPLHVEEIFDLVLEQGLAVEAIYPESVVEKLLSEYPDLHRKAADQGRVTYRVYDDIPFGMSLFDDRVGLRAYDSDTGAPLLLVDTGDSDALEWAETVFAHYREAAEIPEGIPTWMKDTDLRL